MKFRIKSLPLDVVDLIAAGEVIDSLAAVVRELVENALDAKATRITISLWPSQWRVQVADNGMGMDLADLQQAAAAHTTSKISRCEDLWQITSLGFRGEALHSLAALSELEIFSRPDFYLSHFPDKINTEAENTTTEVLNLSPASEGWRGIYNSQGEVIRVEAAAIASGTIVNVANLFGTWTARRQGLPPLNQQLRAVQTTIYHLALCHPQVTWQIQQNDRPWFSVSPGTTAVEILPQILKDVRSEDLQLFSQELALAEATANLQVVIGLPDRCHRHRADWVKVAVNHRIVRSPELEQTILGAFQKTLPRDRYPVCFLHLQVPPAQIDWNRHPAKTEIYLQNLSYWQEQTAIAINQALLISPAHPSPSVYAQRTSKLLKAAETQGNYNAQRVIQPTDADEWEPTTSLVAIAQVRLMYILAEHPAGMWLIEQHIAHERVLYEQLVERWQIVPLEPPLILNQLSVAQLEQLARIGLEVESFGEQLWAIRSAPAPLAAREDCADAILELSLAGDLQAAQVATACRTAIRNGTPLTLPEMQTLVAQWQRSRHPRTCPHGRPIYLPLEESSLARFFRRHWVIGKSHGLA